MLLVRLLTLTRQQQERTGSATKATGATLPRRLARSPAWLATRWRKKQRKRTRSARHERKRGGRPAGHCRGWAARNNVHESTTTGIMRLPVNSEWGRSARGAHVVAPSIRRPPRPDRTDAGRARGRWGFRERVVARAHHATPSDVPAASKGY